MLLFVLRRWFCCCSSIVLCISYHLSGFCVVFITLCPFLFCNYLDEEERAGCFAFIVFLLSCYCKYVVALPHSAMGWSAVCDCGIS